MPFQIDDTGKIRVHNIYFPYLEETNDTMLLLDPRRERLVVTKSMGYCLATFRDLLGAPLPAKRSCRPGSLLIAHREEGHKTQLPGVQVPVQLDRGQTDTQRESGIGCSSQ